MEPPIQENKTSKSQASALPDKAQSPGCLSASGWFLAGYVLSCFSPTFYHQATQRRTIAAVLFFFAFGLTITGLQVLGLGWNFFRAGREISTAFETSSFPEITISKGVAEVSGPQPFIIVDEQRLLMVLDTTGVFNDIDPRLYDQGVLLTRNSLILLTQGGRYQELPLDSLNRALDMDPLIINAETLTKAWTGTAIVLTILAGLFLALWNTVARLAYLALLALVLWGIAALIRPRISFGPVLIAGLYALVPALYIRFLLSQVQVEFLGLLTILLVPIWTINLILTFPPRNAVPAGSSFIASFWAERPVRAWRALIGVPLLADFALEIVFGWKAWFVTWPLAAATLICLALVSLQPLLMATLKPPAPPALGT